MPPANRPTADLAAGRSRVRPESAKGLSSVRAVNTAVEPTVVRASHDVLVWRFDRPMEAISSAAVGGGTGRIDWIMNIGVDRDYARTDLEAHVAEITTEQGLGGRGTALFTAVDVGRYRRAERGDVVVYTTVGVSQPIWAAEPERGVTSPNDTVESDRPAPDHVGGGHTSNHDDADHNVGTINVVAQLPVGLEPGAAVNATMTIAEAKAQALAEAGIAGTGTPTDAAVVAWPAAAPRMRFGGPRSEWGQRLALAVHDAVRAGVAERGR